MFLLQKLSWGKDTMRSQWHCRHMYQKYLLMSNMGVSEHVNMYVDTESEDHHRRSHSFQKMTEKLLDQFQIKCLHFIIGQLTNFCKEMKHRILTR